MTLAMPHAAMLLSCLVLSACTAPSAPESAAMPANTPEQAAEAPAAPSAPAPAPRSTSATSSGNSTETTRKSQGSITGAISIGTRAAPAMRVCAMVVSGGGHHCTMTSAGATQYRIDDIPGGRYHLIGWARDGGVKLLAHADIIRCVMPPCPPDELRVVEVAEGQTVTGIDLSAPYTEVPEGWPGEPAE